MKLLESKNSILIQNFTTIQNENGEGGPQRLLLRHIIWSGCKYRELPLDFPLPGEIKINPSTDNDGAPWPTKFFSNYFQPGAGAILFFKWTQSRNQNKKRDTVEILSVSLLFLRIFVFLKTSTWFFFNLVYS